MNLLERANKTKVEPELLGDILSAVAELPAHERDFEGTTIEIVKRVSELELPDRKRGDLAMAISFRLMALARLMELGGGRGWTAPGTGGGKFVHEELVRATAEEPMIEADAELQFEEDSFHRRLLALAEMHGQA